MPIEISGKPVLNVHTLDSSVTRTETKQRDTVQRDAAPPAAVDTVSLTDTVARLRKLESTLTSLPVIDTHRTEGIRKALESGTFVIDPARVADKLLRFESALYGRAA